MQVDIFIFRGSRVTEMAQNFGHILKKLEIPVPKHEINLFLHPKSSLVLSKTLRSVWTNLIFKKRLKSEHHNRVTPFSLFHGTPAPRAAFGAVFDADFRNHFHFWKFWISTLPTRASKFWDPYGKSKNQNVQICTYGGLRDAKWREDSKIWS